MTWKIHRMHKMYAWHLDQVALLLSPEDFQLALELCRPSITNEEYALFATAKKLGFGNPGKIRRIENTLTICFKEKIQEGAFNMFVEYDYEGERARAVIKDFLEVYRYNYRRISCSSGHSHDFEHEFYCVQLRRPQNALQRLTRRLGTQFEELNFRSDEIDRIRGNAVAFDAVIGNQEYQFGAAGVVRLGEPE